MSFRLAELAWCDAKGFEALVARLRKLGVVKLGALVLGPVPPEARTGERDPREPQETPAERQHRIMFAASTSRPPPPKPAASSGPPPVVPRRQGAGKAARGGPR